MSWSNASVPYAGGRKAPVGGLADAALLDRLLRYKRQVAKRYRVLESAKIETGLPKGNLWISPKLDGELWFLIRRGNDLALCAHNGRVLHGIPLLTALAAKLGQGPDFLVAGELVAPIGEGRPRSHHIATAFADETHARALAFHPFDLVEDAGADTLGRPYAERLARHQPLGLLAPHRALEDGRGPGGGSSADSLVLELDPAGQLAQSAVAGIRALVGALALEHRMQHHRGDLFAERGPAGAGVPAQGHAADRQVVRVADQQVGAAHLDHQFRTHEARQGAFAVGSGRTQGGNQPECSRSFLCRAHLSASRLTAKYVSSVAGTAMMIAPTHMAA
jgi:hypothetical protein